MVKKLFKHEFIALARMMLPVEIIVLALGLLTRFVLFFETEHTAFNVIAASTIVLLVIGLIGSVAAALIFTVIRFYKNLFSKEGYLSLTLPVTVNQHIFVKTVSAAVSILAAMLISIISFSIAFSGDILTEIAKAGIYMFKRALSEFNTAHVILYIIEFVILALISIVVGNLLIYACIAIGQLANKNRIFLAFGVYYGYSMALQVIMTILNIVIIFLADTGIFDYVYDFIYNNQYATVHIVLIGLIILVAVLGFVYYLITKKIMTKKLNLE